MRVRLLQWLRCRACFTDAVLERMSVIMDAYNQYVNMQGSCLACHPVVVPHFAADRS